MKFKLVKSNKYKGTIKTKLLKRVLALGLVGTMLVNFTGCNSNKVEKVETVDLNNIDYSVVVVKDINNNLQTVALDPTETFCLTRMVVYLNEYYTQKSLAPSYFESLDDLNENWENVIAENTSCEYIGTIKVKPLLVAEYGYKVEYLENEIEELITKIQQEPTKYLPESKEKEESAKVKAKTKLSD